MYAYYISHVLRGKSENFYLNMLKMNSGLGAVMKSSFLLRHKTARRICPSLSRTIIRGYHGKSFYTINPRLRSHQHVYSFAASATGVGVICAYLYISSYNSEATMEKLSIDPIERRFSEQEVGPDAVPMKKMTKKTHPCSIHNAYQADCPELVIFSGNAHMQLAKDVAECLGRTVGKNKIGRFNDGEISVKFLESVRGKDIYVIQPLGPPVNENIMELLLMTSALRSASAKRVTVIIPYFAYLREANVTSKTVGKIKKTNIDTEEVDSVLSVEASNLTASLAGSDLARMIEVSGANKVVTVDMQPPGQGAAGGFFRDAQIELLRSSDVVVETLAEVLNLKELTGDTELVVAASHASCITMAKLFKQKLGTILDKNIGVATIIRTPQPPNSEETKPKVEIVGNVKDKTVLIVGDVVDTGGTLCRAAKVAKWGGAKKVYAFSSHPILSRGAAARLNKSPLEKLVVLDTLPVPASKHDKCPKLEQISIANAIAQKIVESHFQPKV
uniref:ribose-phosphate diphosphokinase n=1 Tax=Aplanochytrium stocchinoi TaxID=215587 RepID=A0A7S3PL52_9STRA